MRAVFAMRTRHTLGLTRKAVVPARCTRWILGSFVPRAGTAGGTFNTLTGSCRWSVCSWLAWLAWRGRRCTYPYAIRACLAPLTLNCCCIVGVPTQWAQITYSMMRGNTIAKPRLTCSAREQLGRLPQKKILVALLTPTDFRVWICGITSISFIKNWQMRPRQHSKPLHDPEEATHGTRRCLANFQKAHNRAE